MKHQIKNFSQTNESFEANKLELFFRSKANIFESKFFKETQ